MSSFGFCHRHRHVNPCPICIPEVDTPDQLPADFGLQSDPADEHPHPTRVDLAVALGALAGQSPVAVYDVLRSCGFTSMADVPESKFAEVITAAKRWEADPRPIAVPHHSLREQRPAIHARSISELRRKERDAELREILNAESNNAEFNALARTERRAKGWDTPRLPDDGFGGLRPRAALFPFADEDAPDTRAPKSRAVVTNTPRPGETRAQIAARYRADLAPNALTKIMGGPPKYPDGFKPTNPKDAFGILKAGIFSYVPLPVIFELAIAMAEGAFKYGAHNYMVAGVRASVYTDAAARHLAQFTFGEDNDPDSGAALSHITKAIASLVVLRQSMICGNWVDDRPPALPAGWLEKSNAMMHDLAAKFPEPVARYLAAGKRGPGRVL